MLLRDLEKAYISRAKEINDHGEITKDWKFRLVALLNIQQDLDELDRTSSGLTDYGIIKARTTKKYDIKKGDGISFDDISMRKSFIPEYRVLDIQKIGSTYVYRLEAYNGD